METNNLSEKRMLGFRAVCLPNGHVISDDRARIDMEYVHSSIASSYWAVGRPRELTERSWANSMCFGLYGPDGKQVGFARVLTDYALRAHIADVFLHPKARGLGLGKALVETILEHPALMTVSRWTLTTVDAQDLYKKYGFQPAKADDTWMTMERTGQAGAVTPYAPE